MILNYRVLLLVCALAGAGACHRSEPATTTADAPGRRTVQRSSLSSARWQLVVCSPDERLISFADTLAARLPAGRSLEVRTCADYRSDLPAIFLGDRLPAELAAELPEDSVFRRLRQLDPGDLFTLVNYLNPLTARDSVPLIFTAYISPDPDTLLAHVRRLEVQSRGSIFRSRWAYALHEADGGLRMGTYAEVGWDFALSEEVYLPPIGPADHTSDRVNYFAVDEQLSPDRLITVAAYVERELRGNSRVEEVFVYPSIERIGLRRGRMEPVQWEETAIHLVESVAFSTVGVDTNHHAFLSGMTLAHEGYRVYNGYGGSGVEPSLDSLRRLHVNAVAIVPYTFLRQPTEMQALPVPEDAGSENDPAVRYAIRSAKERGMFVLLKPHIWVNGGWPGDVNFPDEASWEMFFREYGKWIGHYGELAEEEGVEALCIGTELVQTTLTHPEEWRKLIATLRTVYRGKLTYAANWGQEFENLSFWADLDAIGLNSYYPLATAANPNDATLEAGATAWMQRADSISRAYDRPLWLTEVGYRSVQGAWTNPHAEAGDRSESYQDQARCYHALLTAAARSDRLEGMFIWKWPSYLGHREGRNGKDTGYVPGGKPAGSLLRAFYEKH